MKNNQFLKSGIFILLFLSANCLSSFNNASVPVSSDDTVVSHNLFNADSTEWIYKQVYGENLKMELDKIYQELILSENLTRQPLIVIGSGKENPLILNRNDADGTRGLWDQGEILGKWNVHIIKGRYNFRFKFIKPIVAKGQMYLETNTIIN